MVRLAPVLAAALAACSFSARPPGEGDGDGGVDAITDSPPLEIDAPGTTCAAGFLDLCGEPPATEAFVIAVDRDFNTDTDPRCRTFAQAGGPDVCLVMATSVQIAGGTALFVAGSRPLAIASAGSIDIMGILDVSSRRGGAPGPNAQACPFARIPEDDPGGAGGAAGGTFVATGGIGGLGDSDTSLGADGNAPGGLPGSAVAISKLRGGCAGGKGGNQVAAGNQGGAGGAGGGGLYLVARGTIGVVGNGKIRATGGGGTGGSAQAGGGGGGSGGYIILEAPTVFIDGELSANGGGGGEGGANIASVPTAGVSGADGTYGMTAAAGGVGPDDRLGYGGDGGAWMTSGGAAGRDSIVSGGGGGGAVGVIRILGTRTGAGLVTPPAI
ncbi:MAG: hypothetical protein H0T89_30655 [Deltaproteobacteria bacterium]|nr:hypothetical protein [Deltaproteobacteria bacterium]MDQ3298242.1 hypothetical protein [Myxococcota bacterium]